MRKCLSCFIILIFLFSASSLLAAPLELQWNLSKEKRDDNDDKGRYRVYTVPDGWQFEVTRQNFVALQGLSLPSRARYLFRYETEAEILSLEGRAKTGIYMGKEGVSLVFEINPENTQLRFSHGGTVSFISRSLSDWPSKLRLMSSICSGVHNFQDTKASF